MSVAPSAYGSNPRGIGSIDSERFVDTLVYLDLWRSKKKRRVLVSQRAGVLLYTWDLRDLSCGDQPRNLT